MSLSYRNNLKWILSVLAFVVISLILWNTYLFFQKVKQEERLKMELWAEAYKTLNYSEIGADLPLVLEITSRNTTIPLILTDQDENIINYNNIPEDKFNTQAQELLSLFKTQNVPITITYDNNVQYLFYGNSPLLTKLTYYPFTLLLIILLFTALIIVYFQTNKMAAQNKLWAAMAKETAHQIGTPLSSLLGWIEIMRANQVDKLTVDEIEKDVVRLQTIADRFSKIGSKPILEPTDIVSLTHQTCLYLQSRFSNQIQFNINFPNDPIILMLNPTLHSWTIENLIKNSVDATKGKGKIWVDIQNDKHFVKINIKDTGKGIPKNKFNKIFEPGFTTKKRGWGLGLSLVKRIVEEYHGGKIKVADSEINKGTTIRISYRKPDNTTNLNIRDESLFVGKTVYSIASSPKM